MGASRANPIEIVVIGKVRYFSPFEAFNQTPAENKLLYKWEQHYKNLGIRTKVVEEDRPRNKMVNVLYVDYSQDQKVWPRELMEGRRDK